MSNKVIILMGLGVFAVVLSASALAYQTGKTQTVLPSPSPINQVLASPSPTLVVPPSPALLIASPTPNLASQSRIKEIDQEIAKLHTKIVEYEKIKESQEASVMESTKSDSYSPYAGMAGSMAVSLTQDKIDQLNIQIRSLQLEKAILASKL